MVVRCNPLPLHVSGPILCSSQGECWLSVPSQEQSHLLQDAAAANALLVMD